jgi:hypothetical protein
VGEGDAPWLLGEAGGVTVACGLVVGLAFGVAIGVTFGVAVGVLVSADVPDEAEATGLDEATADGVALGNGFACLVSLSRMPARRSRLCLAVKKVSSRVTPKKVAPR